MAKVELRKSNKAAGLNWSCLDFRHTFGSHLAQKGVSLYKIAALMGNSPEICRRHYAALTPKQIFETVEFEDIVSLNSGSHIEAMLGEILDGLDGKEASKKPERARFLAFSMGRASIF